MKNYRVHFSFYSEEMGEFDEGFYSVQADNRYQARREAWLLRDKDDNARFQSCVKQCGVTWEASPLDLRDYLDASAAYEKYMLKYIAAVKLPNAEIRQDPEAKQRAEGDRAFHYGSLESICLIARDIGKPFGMEPPDMCEEIEYAWELVGKLDTEGKHGKAQALVDVIDKAKSWDRSAGHSLKDLFSDGYIHLADDAENFLEHFGRAGVFPERADVNDREYAYTSRWRRAPSIGRLTALPAFDERHVIANSDKDMNFGYRTLVLRGDRLKENSRTPNNLLWMPCEDTGELGTDYDGSFTAENLVTGEREEWQREDFYGVLRPELYAGINFETLKHEYAALGEQERADEDEDDWEGEI
jgi:hypothetical protein